MAASTSGFDRDARVYAAMTGVCGLAYTASYTLVAARNPALGDRLTALSLLLGGILASATFVALYRVAREAEEGYALWALVLSQAGSLGSAVHGGYNLALSLRLPSLQGLPASQLDPRGLLTFGVSGVAILLFSLLLQQSRPVPAWVGYLGSLVGAALVVVYGLHLLGLDARHPVLLALAIGAGVVSPAWYMALAATLGRDAHGAAASNAVVAAEITATVESSR